MVFSPSAIDRIAASRPAGGVRMLIGVQIEAIARREALLRYVSVMCSVVLSVLLATFLGRSLRITDWSAALFSLRADVQVIAVATAVIGALVSLIGWQQIRASQVRVELALLREAIHLDDGDPHDPLG